MMDKFSQFLSEKFLYDQSIAMDLLVQCGLKEQLFDLAKVSSFHSGDLTIVVTLMSQNEANEELIKACSTL